MTDNYNLFYEKMFYEQIFHSDSLKCGGLVTGGKDEKQPFLNEAEQHKISLFPALIEFHTQAKYARLNWKIVDETFRNGKEREAVFREDIAQKIDNKRYTGLEFYPAERYSS